MIKYHIAERTLQGGNGYNCGVPKVERSIDMEGIIDAMEQRGTTATRPDIIAVMELFGSVLSEAIEDGHAINTPLFKLGYSIKGTFEGQADRFDPARHKLVANLTAGSLLRTAARRTKLSKTSPRTLINITSVYKREGEPFDGTIASHSLLAITGNCIKLEGTDPTVGAFLTPTAPNAESIRLANIITNMPKKLILQLPDIAPGDYRLSIITQHSFGNGEGKLLRSATFEDTLHAPLPTPSAD